MARSLHLLHILALLPALFLGACDNQSKTSEEIKTRGELRFITRNSPTTYYLGRSGPRGFEYELASLLAEELEVDLVVTTAFSLDELFNALERGEADIAGAGLTLTEARNKHFASSQSYAKQIPQVVYKVGRKKPRKIEDLAGQTLAVLADSSHEELLEKLRDEGLNWLEWESVEGSDTGELLSRVNEDRSDLAIVDSRDFFIQQNLVPRLEVAFDLAVEEDIVWYLHSSVRDTSLLETINDFLHRRLTDESIAQIERRYFDRDEDISRIDSQTFVGKVRRDLSSYQQLIEIVAREQKIPWELLAAISYQESHWDPKATSRTGVRGMMMLTLATAEEMDVDDRTDPAQSLRGGARYFKKLRRRLPDDILEPDRSWLALAAYNIGMGHLEDARVLTERRGGDPHLWTDIMDTLPLLEEPKHYRTLRYGYARGLEAVRYVQNIRHYYNILRWQTARAERPEAPRDAEPLVPEFLRNLKLRAL
ncbi:membrane-bound lytic murein transglycosylase MltF [Congregibacter variabilis]|uniref:Membrane-bound lytic murein transglycosylase F n=1 Tax=Congregibacter variabilis TaxID=3081200 RepID=A0ABZ0I3K5_9GAMM|nr:membrane-bound lytic murein transglycosylase MltF [Congregibacter sp. IMCC43200]